MSKLKTKPCCETCGEYEGTSYHDPAVHGSHGFKPVVTLTLAQRRVFDLMVQGNTNKQIGRVMERSEKTIKAHVTEILKAAGCDSRGQLIVKHYQNTLPAAITKGAQHVC